MIVIYIYNKAELIASVYTESYEEFNKTPQVFYPEWNSLYYASLVKYNKPIWDNGVVRNMTREEICNTGDLSVLFDGEYYENGKIIKVEYNQELGYLRPTWNRELKQWLDGATDLEKVQAQINEYSELDTPSTLKEMGTELANECMDMLIELRGMAYEMENSTEVDAFVDYKAPLVLPKPSEKLEQFKNKYKSIK